AARLHRGRVPVDEAVEILMQVTRALQAAHKKGVTHRDLKPDNVFVAIRDDVRIVKLLDFGLAKLWGPTEQAPNRTRIGQVLGTPHYTSPEQARGIDVDHRTDIYALGVMAFEMILGRLPFEGATVGDLLCAHIQNPPPAPSSIWPQIPAPLERLIL